MAGSSSTSDSSSLTPSSALTLDEFFVGYEAARPQFEAVQHLIASIGLTAQAGEADRRELMRHTDRVAEIQNTLRTATPVTLSNIEVVVR